MSRDYITRCDYCDEVITDPDNQERGPLKLTIGYDSRFGRKYAHRLGRGECCEDICTTCVDTAMRALGFVLHREHGSFKLTLLKDGES